MSNADLIGHVCDGSQALRESRRKHVETFGTLIPHIFMTDVLARVGLCVRTDRAEAAAILAALERGLAEGERETRNVIAVSFVNDSELEIFFAELKPLLGPRLLGQLQGK